jgi:uncharacterized protein YndB with AHSA1/START domain
MEGHDVELEILTQHSARAPVIVPKRPARLPARRYAAVRVSEKFRASPECVFDAWLDPEIAGRWLFATASRPMASVAIDARVGGSFRFVDRNDGGHVEHTGVYLEIVRPWRLAFTLSTNDGPQAMTRVLAEIFPSRARKGGCELVLAHEQVPAQFSARLEARWTGMLYGLGVTLNT